MNSVTITYCARCRWMLRAQWYAAELLQTFEEELDEVALRPATGEGEAGVFRIEVRHERQVGDAAGPTATSTSVWNRKRDGGFPDIVELKRRVRDLVAPDRPLGHADRADRSAT